jgi:ferredoxin
MDMATKFQEQMLFHLTGRHAGEGLAALDADKLRPALLAPYRDLSRLRHDYPVVLVEGAKDGDCAISLSTLVNRLLDKLAPRGIEGERLRKHVLRLERDLRARASKGEGGELSVAWAGAAARLADASDESVEKILRHAADSLAADGELADCDERLPARFIEHAWGHVQARKAQGFRGHLENLQRRLSDILRAAFVHSEAGQRPDALRAAVGDLHAGDFDFAAMSRLVGRNVPVDELPAPRRARIEGALAVLASQRFVSPSAAGEAAAHPFLFRSVEAAVTAYRERLPEAVELLKAIAVAELEADGRYVEADHDAFFEGYGTHSLTGEDLAPLPDYLVCIPADGNDRPENAGLMDALSSGLPIKVLVQVTDLLEEASLGTGHFAFGVRSARLATTAMGLGGMFVLQGAASSLYRLRRHVEHGLACRGPALFCVFAGAPEAAGNLPRYLTAASAAESRAFPAFIYDAAAGENWAERFSLAENAAPDRDWIVDEFEFADETLQRVRQALAFTYADFALCDRRNAAHFAPVARDRWNAQMIPAAEWLALAEKEAAERVPYVLAVDGEDRLHRVLVDARLMQATRRCLLLWHRLQEHAGIHDSHAQRLLAREKAAWDAKRQQEIESQPTAAPASSGSPVAQPPAAEAAASPDAQAEPARVSDDPWIETARCPSCNECQLINPQMFVYNDNKQAYIKDPDAGTFRQLVEAAESCQVAIIHPGKPRNPKEPGLEELMERAAPFN